tara:strand:- start:484 stop:1392 length:909 start_codon:yes stop_codon:yes gene_type:complete
LNKNQSAKLDAKKIYNNRWKNSLSSGEYNILHDGKPDTQVKYFYDLYCNFILNQIKKVYPDRDLINLSILEIGCGRGTASIFLNKRLNCKSIGIDFSEVSIEIAKKNASFYKSNSKFFIADIFDKNLFKNEFIGGEENFDVVISLGVLEHIESLEECLFIHNKLLKKEGLFCAMVVPEKKSIQDYFELLNKFLFRLNIIFDKQSKKKFNHLDKSLTKTNDVFRTYKSSEYFGKCLRNAFFHDVITVESNPLPTIRPLNILLEKLVVNFFILFSKLYKQIFRKSLFFDCNEKLSRCHFLIGRK